ncbi:MAG: hypothetical protein PHT07_10715 [Paludibacter sp.]|nr:hypothetical protein [Paludibacter sp.]
MKLKLGPILQSDIELGDKINIDRISVYRLRTGKVAKSIRTYLLYSAAATMIDADRALFAKMDSAKEGVVQMAALFQEWESQSISIPENMIDIKNEVISKLPHLTGLFASLDEVKMERLIFLALWEYYNIGENDEKDSN